MTFNIKFTIIVLQTMKLMKTREKLLDYYPESEFLFADGFDDAIIGITDNDIVVYSVNKCIDILIESGLTEEDALEHFHYNVSGGYVGEKTPIWIYDDFLSVE